MIRNFLSKKINNALFGNRDLYGLKYVENDEDWIKWNKFYQNFYLNTQKKGVGNIVNEWGYKVLKKTSLNKKNVFELGPGNLPHYKFWIGQPEKFYAVDVNEKFLSQTQKKIPNIFKGIKVERYDIIPLEDNSIDIILTFYSLEHLYDLDKKLLEFKRILKKNGKIIGAIPNEGGIAWGIGRYLTSRRYVSKNSNINYNKIISWEHPNFSDQIISSFKKNNLKIDYIKMYPFNFIKSLDFNLVTTFILSKY